VKIGNSPAAVKPPKSLRKSGVGNRKKHTKTPLECYFSTKNSSGKVLRFVRLSQKTCQIHLFFAFEDGAETNTAQLIYWCLVDFSFLASYLFNYQIDCMFSRFFKFFKNIFIALGVYALSGFPVSACNQIIQKTDTTKVRYIPEVVVIENSQKNEVNSTAPLQTMNAKSISALNSMQVSDAVKHFSGVTVKDYGGIGGLKTISVRSLGANHTVVSYDGIALTDIQSGQIDIGRFSLENVDMISLSSGQNDNIFQPARLFASASVLNIQTLSPDFQDNKTMNGKISLKVGSFGLVNPSFLLNRKMNRKMNASFGGEWISANGEYPYTLYYGFAGKDSSSLETRKNTDIRNLRLEAALYIKLTERSKGYIKSYFYQSQRGLPGATIYYNTHSFSAQRLYDNTFFTQAHYQHELSRKFSMQVNAKYNRAYLRYLDPVSLNTAGKTESTYIQNELYSSLSALLKASENISFSVSSDVSLNTLGSDMTNFAYPTRLNWLTVMAGKYVTNRVLATVSALYTHIDERVKSGNAAENQRRLSPYISLSVKPLDNTDFRLRAFYKNIFRMPTFNDLYYSRIGNRDLKPEVANQFNLGATYSTSIVEWLPLLTATADLYHNDVKNKIVAYPTKNIFEWTMLNYGLVSIDGLDLTVESTFKLTKNVNLLIGGSHSYQKALNKTNPDDRDYNQQIPYTPRVSGSGRASLETPWLNLNYSMIWSGHRYIVNQNYVENRLGGYSDHSFSISRTFKTKLGLFGASMEVLNILNKNYEVVRFFPMPGRSIRGSVSLKF